MTDQTLPSILVVDDELDVVRAVRRLLSADHWRVLEAKSGIEGRRILLEENPRVVITDLNMPDGDGMFLLKVAQSLPQPPRVIVMTGYGTVDRAVEAMQLGAMTLIQKPFDVDVFKSHVERAFNLPTEVPPNALFSKAPEPASINIAPEDRLMIGHSKALERVYQMISRVGPSDTTVLVTGESGVGKELVARELHNASKRKDGPLVTVNCAAIPEALLESELFGHKKGAFTNATSDRHGKFKQAEGGTIFLDEIGEMKLDLQAKLLRVLQECEFQPVGSNQTIKGDFRVVAATNQPLEELVEKGLFRKDLYYRLSVFPIPVAPLRSRKDDVESLLRYFVQTLNQDRATQITGLASEVLERLVAYPWPGNIRELRNVVERMVILRGDGELLLEDLPERILNQRVESEEAAETSSFKDEVTTGVHLDSSSAKDLQLPETGLDLNEALRNFEIELIKQALSRTGGNRNQAARLLKINRTTLVEKIKRNSIQI